MREVGKLLAEDDGPFAGAGGVEIDETYVGGHKRGRRKRGRPANADPYLEARDLRRVSLGQRQVSPDLSGRVLLAL